MQELKFEITEFPNPEDEDFLTKKINEETPNQGYAVGFAVFIRDNKDVIVAGGNGSIIYGSIYTDQLWIRPELRRQGIGERLMSYVEEYGKKKGCTLSTVTTMSFQAPKFYLYLGYKIDFSREGYNQGSSCIFMSKKI